MITKHNFDRDRICTHCGMFDIEAAMVRSKFCGIRDCTHEEWENMQVYHLTRNVPDEEKNS